MASCSSYTCYTVSEHTPVCSWFWAHNKYTGGDATSKISVIDTTNIYKHWATNCKAPFFRMNITSTKHSRTFSQQLVVTRLQMTPTCWNIFN